LVICAIYLAVGTTLVLVLRRMSRGPQRDIDESDVPYGPAPVTLERETTEVPVS
jgi:hypothetical protein